MEECREWNKNIAPLYPVEICFAVSSLPVFLPDCFSSWLSGCPCDCQSIRPPVRPSSCLFDSLSRLSFRLSVVRILCLYCYEYSNCYYFWPRLFEWWITLSTGWIAIQWLSFSKTSHAIHWIVSYSVDSVIHLLNNRGLVCNHLI